MIIPDSHHHHRWRLCPFWQTVTASSSASSTQNFYNQSSNHATSTRSATVSSVARSSTDNEGPWFLTDILVNVNRGGEDFAIGVIREVIPDGSCKVALGSSGIGETVNALPSDIEIVTPRKTDRIKIMGGAHRGASGKLIGIDGTDGIVKIDDTLDVKILDMGILAKFVKLDKS